MSRTIDALELQVTCNSGEAVKGLDALTSTLTRLQKAVSGGAKLNALVGQLEKIGQAVKGLNLENVDKLGKLSSLNGVKISPSIANQIGKVGQSMSAITPSGIDNLERAAGARC